MKRFITLIRRALAKYQVRSLEITLLGQNEALEVIRDPLTREQIILTRSVTQRELAKARAAYVALLPIGERPTFKVA